MLLHNKPGKLKGKPSSDKEVSAYSWGQRKPFESRLLSNASEQLQTPQTLQRCSAGPRVMKRLHILLLLPCTRRGIAFELCVSISVMVAHHSCPHPVY